MPFFYFIIQGMTKEEIPPSAFMGLSHILLTLFLPAFDTFPKRLLQYMGIHATGWDILWVKLSITHWGLGTKSWVTQSILFCVLPALTLGVPLFSC